MASSRSLASHYRQLLRAWPKDHVRAESVAFQHLLQNRLQRVSAASPTSPEPSELRQVNALYSLLDNRYKSLHPVSERVLKPVSNPEHYDDLIKEFEEAPKRSRFGRWLNSWKGFLRFS